MSTEVGPDGRVGMGGRWGVLRREQVGYWETEAALAGGGGGSCGAGGLLMPSISLAMLWARLVAAAPREARKEAVGRREALPSNRCRQASARWGGGCPGS